METPHSAPPEFSFTAHPSVSSFNVPYPTYLFNRAHENLNFTYVATGVLVFDTSYRMLLLQRAAGDSMPHLWEIPGGACDEEDRSILYGAARELWEEAGIRAKRIGPQVGAGDLFQTSTGKKICKFSFLVEPEAGELDVQLSVSEHQNFVWANEEEVRAKKVGKVELKFTSRETESVVVQAFEARKERLKI